MRKAARIDSNQPEIVKTFQDLGCTVQHLHTIGNGCPDILVGYRSMNFLVEIKDGRKIPSQRNLTIDEKRWHLTWRGQVCIIKSVDEAINFIKYLKKNRKNAAYEIIKTRGHWLQPNCPYYGDELKGNHQNEERCENIKCDYGIEYWTDMNVQSE